jgi:cation diffusion facilitator family transporter
MADCCNDKAGEIDVLRERQSTVLKTVLAINATMFLIEAVAGIMARSTALLADSLDMLGDALVYGFSLFVIARSARWKAAAALSKGLVMVAFGLGVVFEGVHKVTHPVIPEVETMGMIGLLALAANATCFVLLWRHRDDDINMQSTWLCSRNDVIANVSVLFAAAGVWSLNSMWPDILVGSIIAVIFLQSAVHVINASMKELRE